MTHITFSSLSFSKIRNPLSQLCAVMVKNLVLLSQGMTVGFITILIPYLSVRSPDESIYLDQEGISWIGSIGTICFPLGSIVSGALINRVGRRTGMQLGCVPFIITCIGLKYSATAWQIFLCLGVNGFTGGFIEAPVITYVGEITEPSLRGAFSATANLTLFFGVLIEFALGIFMSWRNVAFVTCVAPLICFCLLFIIPESPQWLIMRGRYIDAKKSLAWLRGWTDVSKVEDEFQEILTKQIKKHEYFLEHNILYKYTRKDFILPTILLSFMFFISQFTGASPLRTYAVNIFSALQVPIDKFQATLLLGVAEILGVIPCIALIHYIGKRVLLFYSIILGTLSVVALATYAHLTNIEYIHPGAIVASSSDTYNWLPLAFIIIAIFAFQGGVRVVPWILMGEIFSRPASSMGSGISSAVSSVFSFLANKTFLSIVSHITLPGTLWLYGFFGICGLIILYFWLPETEGKALQEITDHFAGITKLDNRVRRLKHNNKNNSL